MILHAPQTPSIISPLLLQLSEVTSLSLRKSELPERNCLPFPLQIYEPFATTHLLPFATVEEGGSSSLKPIPPSGLWVPLCLLL